MTQETTPEVKGFGAMLREARESLGISIGDVSSRTRLSVDQIRAIEEEDLERLPEPVYVRAFLRAYAKAIGIDYEPVVNDYVTRCGGGGVRIPEHAPEEAFREVAYYDTPRPSRWKFVGLLALIVVVTLGIWGVYSGTFARLMEADGTEAAKVENGVSEVAPNVAQDDGARRSGRRVEAGGFRGADAGVGPRGRANRSADAPSGRTRRGVRFRERRARPTRRARRSARCGCRGSGADGRNGSRRNLRGGIPHERLLLGARDRARRTKPHRPRNEARRNAERCASRRHARDGGQSSGPHPHARRSSL